MSESPETRPATADEHRLLLDKVDMLQSNTVDFSQAITKQYSEISGRAPITYNELRDLFGLTREFFGASQAVTDYLYNEALGFAESLADVPGYIGEVGLGYPFYAIVKNRVPTNVPEISSFIDLTRDIIDQENALHPEAWICPDCQVRNKLPDLKTFCKPCDLTVLKPRDIFRALPDVDVAIIVDNPSQMTEALVENKLNVLGYSQSDTNITDAIERIQNTLNSFKKGESPVNKLPIDVHIWSTLAVNQCLDLVAQGELNTTIISRSLHTEWEDNPINFWFDFVFSFTELDLKDDALSHKINLTRKSLKEKYSADKLLQYTGESSKRATRLLQSDDVRNILRDRIQSW